MGKKTINNKKKTTTRKKDTRKHTKKPTTRAGRNPNGLKPSKKNEATYKIYVMWRVLPRVVHRMNEAQLDAIGMDRADPITKKMIGCSSMTAFGKEFGIGREALYEWERSKQFAKDYRKSMMSFNYEKYAADVLFSFTQKTIKEADAPRFKLWAQFFMEWLEKQKIVLEDELSDEDMKTIKRAIANARGAYKK